MITQAFEAMVADLGTTEAVLTTASKKYVDTSWFLLYWSDASVSVYWTIVLERYISQYIRLLCWRDASLNTLGYCIGEMHPSIHCHIVL